MKKILFIPILLFSLTLLGQTPLHFLIAKKVSGGGFTPPAGCKLWVKADQITGLNDGDAISTWEDQSGVSNDLTSSLTERPTYQTNELNSLPVVRFDGSNDFMQKASPTGLDGGTGMTIIIVVKSAEASDDTYLSKADYNTQNSWTWQTRTGDGQDMRTFIFSSDTDAGCCFQDSDDAALLAGWYVLTMVYDGSQATNADRVKYYKDGTLLTTSTNGTIPTSLNSSTASLKIARLGGGIIPRYYNGDFAEVFIFDSALGTTDRESVEDYLATKYGL